MIYIHIEGATKTKIKDLTSFEELIVPEASNVVGGNPGKYNTKESTSKLLKLPSIDGNSGMPSSRPSRP